MKRFTIGIVALAALVAFSSPLFAANGKTMFGLKGGLNMANVIGDDVENTSMKIGFVGGVFVCYNITEIFAIQPELLYSQKGAKVEIGTEEFSWKTDYFEVPLLLKVNLPTEGKMKPSLYAGPAIGILMTAKLEDEDIKDDLKGTDFGIIAGGAVAYQMESGSLSFEFRYEVGLQSIIDAEGLAVEPDVKNSVMSIMVGYGFAF